MSVADTAIAILVNLVWGLNFAVAKAALAELPPILLMALRFALVAALTVPFVRFPAAPLPRVLLLSFTLGFLHFALFFTGLKGIDVAVAAIVIQLQVPFAVILAALLLRDRPGWRRLLGIALAFSGVTVIFARGPMGGDLPSLLLMLGAAAVWSIANFQIKALGQVDGLALNGWIAFFAWPQLLAASLLLEDGQWAALLAADWRGWGGVAYMALLSTILGYGLWYRVIGRYPMSLVMPFTLLAPVFGVLSGVALLDEAFTPRMAVGGLLTIAGIAIIVLRRPRRPRTSGGTGP